MPITGHVWWSERSASRNDLAIEETDRTAADARVLKSSAGADQDSQVLSLRGRRLEEYRLPYREPPASSDGAVDSSLVVPHPNDRLQHIDG